MDLASIYPGFDIIRSPLPELPLRWCRLLDRASSHCAEELVECIGLAEGTASRRLIVASSDIGVVVPKRKAQRSDRRFWKLALLLSEGYAMSFRHPEPNLTHTHAGPSEYTALTENFGPCRLTQFSGEIVSPHIGPELASKLPDEIHDRHDNNSIVVFYDHFTGDYDMWIGAEYERTLTFDHELRTLNVTSVGPFASWFDKRLRMHVES